MSKRTKASANIRFQDHDEASGVEVTEEGNRMIRIREFDLNWMHPRTPQDLEHASKCLVIGKPGLGKSKVIEHIMLYKAWICPVSQCFSGTEAVNHTYADRTTDITVYNELDLKAMEDFLKRQVIARQYLPNCWALQVLDDVTDEPNMLRKHPFGAYFKRGRWLNLLHIEAVQYPMDIPSGLRSCVDYVFCMGSSIIAEREKIYENFASGAIGSFADFCDIMDQINVDHTALVIDNTSTSSNITDRCFYFKADLSRVPKDFRLGCPDAYKFQAERLDPNYTSTPF